MTLRRPSAGYRLAALVATLATATCVYEPCRADEPVQLNRVPGLVRRVAATRAPGVRFSRAVHDAASGYFKLTGKDALDRTVRVVADESAEFVQVTIVTPIRLKDVPRAVIETHNQTVRQSRRWFFEPTTILRAEQSVAGDDARTVLYEFLGKNASGEPMRQVIREDGVNIGLGSAPG